MQEHLGGRMQDSVNVVVDDIAGSTTQRSVFLDLSGRRWRTTRIIGIGLLVVCSVALLFGLPKMWADPALDGQVSGRALSMLDTGSSAPEVGAGPLLRALKVRVVGGQKVGFEPFTGKALVTLTGTDAELAGKAASVLQRFGYSTAAKKTISMTFDDGPDPKNPLPDDAPDLSTSTLTTSRTHR